MNTFVIHVFFTIVVFMLLLVNLKKIKNMFYSEHYEEDGLNTDNNEQIIKELIDNNCIKFGNYTLKNGEISKYYFDMKNIIEFCNKINEYRDYT